MARSIPPLTWFRAFESAARTLSFTAAAQELGMTQSAVSQQINALETRFGCQLFLRKNRGLALTDEGRRLVPSVRQAIATLRHASESFDADTNKQLLTVATSVSIAQWYLVPRMKYFLQANPNIGVRLMTKVWPDEFGQSGVDVEIRFDSLKSESSNAVTLGSGKSIMVCSPGLIQGNIWDKSLSELIDGYPLIQVVGTSDTWQAWSDKSEYSGELNPTTFVDSHGMAVDFARSGTGIALTSQVVAAPSLCDGSLIQLNAPHLEARDGYHTTIFPSHKSELSERFIAWLSAEVEKAETDIPQTAM